MVCFQNIDTDVESSVTTNKEIVPSVKDHTPVNPPPQSSTWQSRKKVLPPPVMQRKELHNQDRKGQQGIDMACVGSKRIILHLHDTSIIHNAAATLPLEARKSSLPNLKPEKETPRDTHKDGNLKELQKTVAQLSENVVNLSHRVDQLQVEIKKLKQASPAGQQNENSSVTDDNIESLRNLSHAEVH